MAALTGAIFDAFADPERILDPEYRQAVRSLAGGSELLAPVLRLLEEMALVGGFDPHEVLDLHRISEPMQQALVGEITPGEQPVHITVTQEYPSEAPRGSTGLPFLLRASQRAETPIHLAPAEDHTIRIEVAPHGAVSFNAEQFQMLTVGPAGTIAAPVRFRPARVVLNRSTRTLRFYLGRFEDSNTPMPVRVRLPVPRQNENQEVRASLEVSMRWPHLRVRDLRNMDLANRMLREGGLLMELLVEQGNQLLGRTRHTRSETGLFPIGVWQGERLRGLTGLDGDQPVPLFVPPATLTGLVGVDSAHREEQSQQLRTTAAAARPEITSAVLLFQEVGGSVIDEQFLRFLPGRGFAPPKLTLPPGTTITQEEFEQRWQAGLEHFEVRMFIGEDVNEIAGRLRAWAGNPQDPFPIVYDPQRLPTAATRTCLSFSFFPRIDRVWHLEHPVQIGLRPTTRAEAYQQEAVYWRSHNDERRAALAEEIMRRKGEAG